MAPTERRRPLLLLDHILVIAGKQLVAAVSGEHHLDVFGCELRHHIRRDRGGVAERLVEVPGEVFDDADDVGLQDQIVVVGLERRGHRARVVQLVERRLGEADRKGLQRRA